MVEQLSKTTEQFGAEEYMRLGGRWSANAFDRLMEILDERKTNPIQIRRVFIDQAQGMGVFTGLVVTPEEEYLYGVLCQTPIERDLSQQQLLAELMLVTGNPDKRKDFMLWYPGVNFNKKGMPQKETSELSERTRQVTYSTEIAVFAYGR